MLTVFDAVGRGRLFEHARANGPWRYVSVFQTGSGGFKSNVHKAIHEAYEALDMSCQELFCTC